MPDISTVWNPAAGEGDWMLAGADLQSGGDLPTAVLISLFTDRRADPDDVIPDGSGNPRGWWGDLGRDRPIGSKLWLLERSKAPIEQVRLAAQDYAADALQWLIETGVAAEVAVVASWQASNFLGLVVTITEPSGGQQVFNYQWAWGSVS